ncbi:translocation and assembly module lipoprotein TamL [Mucilaginibacter pocheonensis]|uniref:Outer membrane protein assembly factor BamA n=1 Tax=Mucilaginibacter pocheonensis TaxID=398050 RepID=A0ABU1T5C1_9SPHI|nr:BamA/TamA family outer membrane protein [Mucilaginibacter pocheonensis]MDR6940581.1 outer membrane protein assembly factor BamA [Mucilaginibacter pocheonensis]
MTKHFKYILILSVLLSACSNTKYLLPGQKLYTGGQVKIQDKDIKKGDADVLTDDLKTLLRPKPNSAILGLRVKLWIYNKTRTKKTKGFAHWLNTKFGEPPVLASAVDLEKNSSILQNRLQNESYFQAQVSGDTVSKPKSKTAKAVYTALAGPAYKIRKVIFPPGNTSIDTAVAGTAAQTFLKPGNNYNLDVIKNERIRIDARLKEEGFYFFAPEDLIMRVDSTIAGHQVDIFVAVKNDIAERAQEIYTIRDIYVFPSYSLRDTSLNLDKAQKYRWYNIVEKRKTVNSYIFANTVLMRPNQVYNRTAHNNSLNRFVNLGPYKFVKNRFEDVTPDSPKLDVYYFLTPYKKKSLQLEILGRTTSANYTGTQVNVNWLHRNAFKGGEALKVTLFGSTDVQVGGNNSGFNVYQAGIQTTLSWPRFISPIYPKADNAYIPHTNFTLGYTLVNRQKLYTLNSFNASFGYQWKENVHRTHELNVFNLMFVNPQSVSKLYTDSIENTHNPALRHVIEKQFILGPSYSYTFTNTTEDYRTNTLYYNGKVSLSNNIYGLVTGADTTAGKVKKLFGAVFNQYVKLENELRYFHKTGPASSFASRLIVAVGLPYGNSTQLPYSQQFFIGGPNSLRGFQARSLGPGSYDPRSDVKAGDFLPDESGDIKVEANVEYRPKLFSIVRGALFVDAGNIWLLHSNSTRPGAGFTKSFLNNLAVDAGFGLRFDLSVLVLRTDMGYPLRTPYLPAGQRWGFNSRYAVFNLAIGYPF